MWSNPKGKFVVYSPCSLLVRCLLLNNGCFMMINHVLVRGVICLVPMKSKLLKLLAKVVSLVFWTYMKTLTTKFLVVPFPWKLRCWILCFYLIKVFHLAHPNKSPIGMRFVNKTFTCNCGFMIFIPHLEIKKIIDVHLTLVLAIFSWFLDQIMFSIKIV